MYNEKTKNNIFRNLLKNISVFCNKLSVTKRIIFTSIFFVVIVAFVTVIYSFTINIMTSVLPPVFSRPITNEALLDRIVTRLEQENVQVTVTSDNIVRVQDEETAMRMREIIINENLLPYVVEPQQSLKKYEEKIDNFIIFLLLLFPIILMSYLIVKIFTYIKSKKYFSVLFFSLILIFVITLSILYINLFFYNKYEITLKNIWVKLIILLYIIINIVSCYFLLRLKKYIKKKYILILFITFTAIFSIILLVYHIIPCLYWFFE